MRSHPATLNEMLPGSLNTEIKQMKNFTEVKINQLNGKLGNSRKFSVHKSGAFRISPALIDDLGINTASLNGKNAVHTPQYLHFLKDDDGSYYIYVNSEEYNGLRLRIFKKEKSTSIILQCRSLVDTLIRDLDLAIGPDKLKSVKLDVDTTPEYHNGDQVWRLY
jgi:hypothetical protein